MNYSYLLYVLVSKYYDGYDYHDDGHHFVRRLIASFTTKERAEQHAARLKTKHDARGGNEYLDRVRSNTILYPVYRDYDVKYVVEPVRHLA